VAQLSFTKMQGLGNDFMVINAMQSPFTLTETQIRAFSNRHFGIGFDQLLVVEPAQQAEVDFRYRIFNADGSEVQQCGNGARCFARFVYDKGLTDKTEIAVETASGVIVLYIQGDGVRVNMGKPNFAPASLPFIADAQADQYEIEVDVEGQTEVLQVGAVSMGNPHTLVVVEDIESAPVARFGPVLESHGRFPERVNVGFAQKISESQVALRVYERGAAETLACGTGACAAMAVLRQRNEVADRVQIFLQGGELIIEWDGNPESVLWMTGPAVTVFEGQIEI